MLDYCYIRVSGYHLKIAYSESGISKISIRSRHSSAPRQSKKVSQPQWFSKAIQLLKTYFSGRVADLSRIPVELDAYTPFQKKVFKACRNIPFGDTLTYAELASKVGNRNRARAVGNALNKNAVPVVIPCHRVVSHSGLGGFAYGAKIKKQLLENEGVRSL